MFIQWEKNMFLTLTMYSLKAPLIYNTFLPDLSQYVVATKMTFLTI